MGHERQFGTVGVMSGLHPIADISVRMATGREVPERTSARAEPTVYCRTRMARIRKFHAEVAIAVESFARALAFAISQPKDVDINEILFRPTRQEI